MGRRHSNILQGIVAVGGRLPWWATLLLALAAWALLHQLAVSEPATAAGSGEALADAVPDALRQVALYAQYIVPWVLLAGMFTSLIRRAAHAQLSDTPPARGDRSWEVQFEASAHEQAWPEEPAEPACPRCKGRMIRRTARRGQNAGHEFWGCSRFPACHGTRELPAEEHYPISA